MKRFLLGLLLLTLVAGGPSSAAAKTKRAKASFVISAIGATATNGSASRLLLDVKDGPAPSEAKSVIGFGHGAASLLVTPGDEGQTARGHAYYADASLALRMTYAVGAPDADGSSPVTGSGTLRGKGAGFRHGRGTFHVTGTQSDSGAVTLQLAGKITYRPVLVPTGSGRGH